MEARWSSIMVKIAMNNRKSERGGYRGKIREENNDEPSTIDFYVIHSFNPKYI
jgi:hypothetical protein